jgi:hypothetical protein
MKEQADKLIETLDIFQAEFTYIDENVSNIKLSEDKWTLKEIIGHLIDSASNNHQRFIRLQLTDSLEFPDYKNTDWLKIHNYSNFKYTDLFNLFVFYNKLLAHIILGIAKNNLQNKWNIVWNGSPDITLEALINHYIEHLKGHLQHCRERLAEVKNKPIGH